MGLSSDTAYQKWRENARWGGASEDRYTELWSEMVRAYRAHLDSLTFPGTNQQTGYSNGLVKAYCLVTGDDSTSVYRQLIKAVDELIPSRTPAG